ncbi:MAG: iron-containing alcohol dehydrogenase [Spirochaetales bacterium]
MLFEFATSGRVVFGAGTSDQLTERVRSYGRRPFLVSGASAERYRYWVDECKRCDLETAWFRVSGEPDTATVASALEQAREHNADVVIAIGGGSVIDTGKVVSALLTNPGDLSRYLEVVGEGKPITEQPVPYIAVPTTAGTGSEATKNAVISVPEERVKVSVRSPLMLPNCAIVDPSLTLTSPARVTATSGLDALTQLIEAFTSRKATPMTDGFCREGLSRAGRSLRQVWQNPGNERAREDMALASLFSGIALGNAGLGAVHGFAGPLGGLTGAPHGAICAALLGPVTRANLRALESHGNGDLTVDRYREAAALVTGNDRAATGDLLEWILETVSMLEVQSLSYLGLDEATIPEAVAKARKSSSMKGNPVTLDEDELAHILKVAL